MRAVVWRQPSRVMPVTLGAKLAVSNWRTVRKIWAGRPISVKWVMAIAAGPSAAGAVSPSRVRFAVACDTNQVATLKPAAAARKRWRRTAGKEGVRDRSFGSILDHTGRLPDTGGAAAEEAGWRDCR